MARQRTTPVPFNMSRRQDKVVAMTTGRAGKVVPLGFIPLLRGDSASGKVGIDVDLMPMPRPLQNGVHAHFQAWFVPKTAHPQFSGLDEFMHSYLGETIPALGAAARTPPAFFTELSGGAVTTVAASEFFKTLGLHIPAGASINTDLIDAFSVIYNFRLRAHSSRLPLRPYAAENLANSVVLPPAFWPTGRLSKIVPDYERALIVGAFDLDVAAGQLDIKSAIATNLTPNNANAFIGLSGVTGNRGVHVWRSGVQDATTKLFAEMAGREVTVTLADMDKARLAQSFGKIRASFAGSDTSGYMNDDAIIATLMQGFSVPDTEYRRPWLLDSKRVPVGFMERGATDGANLQKSITEGRASAILSINVPKNDFGGLVMYTVEIMPERLDERMSDEWVLTTSADALPNALRDVQRTEPVDIVPNRRIDAKHTSPSGAYGYEPMNDKWNRVFTRLGGAYYQATPGTPWTEQRSAIWQVDYVNPTFNDSHYLCPAVFPHDVFSDTLSHAWEAVVRHDVTIVGLTQIGDVLQEDNDDYEAVENEADE